MFIILVWAMFLLYRNFVRRQEIRLRRCLDEANTGNVDGAIKSVLQVIRDFPMSVQAHETLARLYELDHRFQKAAERYTMLIDMAPSSRHAEILSHVGRIYLKAGDLSRAVVVFRDLCQLEPDSFRHKMELSSVLLGLEWWSEAASLLEQVSVAVPENPVVRMRLATALLRSGRTAESKRVFNDLVSEDPSRISARYHLAEIMMSESLWSDALVELKLVLEKADGRLRACALLEAGNCCLELKRPVAALSYYEEGADLTSDKELLENFRFNKGLAKKLAEEAGKNGYNESHNGTAFETGEKT